VTIGQLQEARMRIAGLILGIVVMLAGRAPGVASSQAAPPAPRFNPDWQSSGGPICLDEPPRMIEREWQVSAPRGFPGPVRPGDLVQLGLRDKFGGMTSALWVLARVIGPDGSSTTATAFIQGDQWAYVRYPHEFVGAVPVAAGVYTVVWEAGGGFIACDGFVVRNY
jgi:hypothetical protein